MTNKSGFLILPGFILFLFTSCGLKHGKNIPPSFYDSISDWDISYIPLIKPNRLSSIDKGDTWMLNGSLEVKSFAVSGNVIYGEDNDNNWFFFDTKSDLLAAYKSREELRACLHAFKIKEQRISGCNTYFDTLTQRKACYWFPAPGKEYPEYPPISPERKYTILVTEPKAGEPVFEIKEPLIRNSSHIYFFSIESTIKNNDLYYFSFNNEQPLLIKDGAAFPVFLYQDQFSITLYTPFPVAEEKGIPETKRLVQALKNYMIR